ncbi:hypothetical protein SNEBB_008972 [Seison nebaliae]|nr:hypothetical protein SNEBB_008972 [Seison nebaliae]
MNIIIFWMIILIQQFLYPCSGESNNVTEINYESLEIRIENIHWKAFKLISKEHTSNIYGKQFSKVVRELNKFEWTNKGISIPYESSNKKHATIYPVHICCFGYNEDKLRKLYKNLFSFQRRETLHHIFDEIHQISKGTGTLSYQLELCQYTEHEVVQHIEEEVKYRLNPSYHNLIIRMEVFTKYEDDHFSLLAIRDFIDMSWRLTAGYGSIQWSIFVLYKQSILRIKQEVNHHFQYDIQWLGSRRTFCHTFSTEKPFFIDVNGMDRSFCNYNMSFVTEKQIVDPDIQPLTVLTFLDMVMTESGESKLSSHHQADFLEDIYRKYLRRMFSKSKRDNSHSENSMIMSWHKATIRVLTHEIPPFSIEQNLGNDMSAYYGYYFEALDMVMAQMDLSYEVRKIVAIGDDIEQSLQNQINIDATDIVAAPFHRPSYAEKDINYSVPIFSYGSIRYLSKSIQYLPLWQNIIEIIDIPLFLTIFVVLILLVCLYIFLEYQSPFGLLNQTTKFSQNRLNFSILRRVFSDVFFRFTTFIVGGSNTLRHTIGYSSLVLMTTVWIFFYILIILAIAKIIVNTVKQHLQTYLFVQWSGSTTGRQNDIVIINGSYADRNKRSVRLMNEALISRWKSLLLQPEYLRQKFTAYNYPFFNDLNEGLRHASSLEDGIQKVLEEDAILKHEEYIMRYHIFKHGLQCKTKIYGQPTGNPYYVFIINPKTPFITKILRVIEVMYHNQEFERLTMKWFPPYVRDNKCEWMNELYSRTKIRLVSIQIIFISLVVVVVFMIIIWLIQILLYRVTYRNRIQSISSRYKTAMEQADRMFEVLRPTKLTYIP